MSSEKDSMLENTLLTSNPKKRNSLKITPKVNILQWRDLNYTIRKKQILGKKIEKKIINNVFGFAKKGEITALVGKSGAGKTSLLNILAQKIKKRQKILEGNITINDGIRPSSRFLRSISAYMRQDDVFHEALTPQEIIWNAAKLVVEGTDEFRKERVDGLIRDLNLEECRNARVGGFGRKGISGGQKRRVSLALELLPDPQILFLDEPTSGLDSFTALLVMSLIKKEAK